MWSLEKEEEVMYTKRWRGLGHDLDWLKCVFYVENAFAKLQTFPICFDYPHCRPESYRITGCPSAVMLAPPRTAST